MKIKKPAFIAFISMILSGIGILGYLELRNHPAVAEHRPQHQTPQPAGDRSTSISLGTVLLLLAVGISGALGIRRKKKKDSKLAQIAAPQTIAADRDKAFVRLNKQYLNLQYKITQNKLSGETPPSHFLKEISELERKVRLISRALE